MKDETKYLIHILQSIELIEEFVLNLSKEDFKQNSEKQFAVIRGIEVIGEAVKNIPQTFKEKYPFIKWRDIAGTRDVLIHAYFSVDTDLIWDIVKRDLPLLKKQVNSLLRE
ncbi:DUF86 domain-containing protein [Candidatus Woesearchaeota archaeon]|nr:DUF86 domain-containing protein [Candidatus Woesearchaeota archaeon]